MRYELRLHRLLVGMLAALLAVFVAVLYYLDRQAGEESFEAAVSLVVVMLAATIFAYMGTAEGIVAFYFGAGHGREFVGYLVLGMLAAGSALYLALSQGESLQVVSLIASPHAFFFGLAELRMARHLERHARERRALMVGGGCELALGLGLVWGGMLPSRRTVEILGGVALLTMMQLLAMLLYREVPAQAEPS